jgi:CheY-like chemotaxis protein
MRRILLVEDEPVNVKLIARILERKGGYEVRHSEDPEEILALAASGEYALVVMDVSLSASVYNGHPVNGLEITRMMKEDPRSASVPVILATAHTMKGDRESFMAESGADDYVGKPITDFDAFLAMIARHVDAREAGKSA